MPRNDLKITIDAEAARAEREIKRVEASIRGLDRELAKAGKTADAFDRQLGAERARALDMVGKSMVAFGAATLAGLGLATKAAIDWESAWAGVRKTVEGSDEELAAVEAGLRELATTLPATHGQIAAVAEAAGQLGVATEDVVGFTKVMVDLGATTNLTAEEAATSIAQLMNIMGTAPDQVSNLGAALVELGNNGASTERDIIQMAARIAGAGRIVGLTEADVLGFANALASVGIEVEAGGSAVSRVIQDIGKAVATGSDKLDGFAQVAGVSADEFARSFREDPAAAIASFVEGLGRIDAAGGDVFTILDDLGQSDIRVSRALLSMAGAGNLLRDSLDMGARAWEDNTALIEEAEKRYDTAAAKIQIAQNALVDLAIDIGGVVLPMVAKLAEIGADLLTFFADLPGPVKTAVTILGGLAGVIALLGGGFLLLAPRLLAAHQALQLIAATSPKAAAGLGLVSKAAGALGIFAALAVGIAAFSGAARKASVDVSEMTKALLDLRAGDTNEAINRLVESYRELNSIDPKFQDDVQALISGQSELTDQSRQLAAEFEAVDEALAGMVAAGSAVAAEEAMQELAAALGITGTEVDAFVSEKLPQYEAALLDAANAEELAGDNAAELTPAQRDMADAFGLTAGEAGDAADAIKDLNDELDALLGRLFSVEEAQDNLTQAINDATDAEQAANRTSLEKREIARGLVEDAFDLIRANAEQGATTEQLNKIIATQKDRLYDAFIQMGLSKDEARRYADSLDEVPGLIDTTIALSGMTAAQKAVADFRRRLAAIPDRVSVRFEATGAIYGTGRTEFQHGGKLPGPSSQAQTFIGHGQEWVINPAASAFYGDEMLRAINEMRFSPVGPVSVTNSTAGAAVGPVGVRVFIGDREIRDIVRVEVDTRDRSAARGADLYARGG